MEDKKSFLMYADYIELFDELSDLDAGKLIKHILRYVNDQNPVSDDPMVKISFIPIKQQLKRDLVKWNDKIDRQSKSGSMGNLKRWNPDLYDKVIAKIINLKEALIIASDRKTSQPDPTRSYPIPKIPDNVNVNVNDNVNDNVNKEKGLPFKKFWDSFDKKIGSKQKCNQKWDKLTFEIQNDILNHLDDYIPSTPDKRYRVNPETYLNQRRWENEIINNQDGTKKQRGATDEQILTSIINAQE